MTTKAKTTKSTSKKTVTKVKKTNAMAKFQNFLNMLAKAYGPGKHITAAQAAEVYEAGKKTKSVALWRNFAKNYSYKLGHGEFRVSTKILPLRNAAGQIVARV